MPKKQNTRRADGRIAVQVYVGRKDGKRQYKTVYGQTQKEAEQKAQELKIKLNKGIDVNTNDVSFSYWSDKFLEAKKEITTGAVYRTYKFRAQYFMDCFCEKEIIKLKLFELQNAVNELANCNPVTKKRSAKKTIIGYLSVLNQIFDYAIANRVIDYNPAEFVRLPLDVPAATVREAITREQQKWIADTPHFAQTAAMIMLYTGLRRGELTALLWSDVNLDEKLIKVYRNYDFKNKIIKEPKTSAGVRSVPIPDNLLLYLRDVKQTSLFVFPSKANTMMLEGSWSRIWNSYMKILNKKYGDFSKVKQIEETKDKKQDLPIVINTFTPHQLRHTFCTMLYDAGVDVVTAKYLMGHSDIKTTLNIYTHLSNENKKTNIDKLNDFLNKINSASQDASQNTQ